MTNTRSQGWAVLVLLVAVLGATLPVRGDDDATDKALAYLAREVPAWSREHRCFSCHNNGDAARALYQAVRLGRTIPKAATEDTDAWLAQPEGWDRNGGDGPFSDKVLARVAFASGLASGMEAKRVEASRAPLIAAGRRLIVDQSEDGSWRVDEADPVGSPATYGRPLATWLAVEALRRAEVEEFRPAIDRATAWLDRVEPTNAPGSAVVLLSSGAERRVDAALFWFRQAQAGDGGWGPYRSAPPEVFDTALGVLAMSRHRDRPGASDLIRKGRAFLVANQRDNGSWAETTRPSGGESYAQRLSTTGWATLALLSPADPKAAQNLHPTAFDDPAIAANLLPNPLGTETIMADPRNIAHDKKVQEEKKHHNEPVAPENAAVAPQPGKKTPTVKEDSHEVPTSHATSQHHKDKTTGHVEEPAEVQAEVNAKVNATDK